MSDIINFREQHITQKMDQEIIVLSQAETYYITLRVKTSSECHKYSLPPSWFIVSLWRVCVCVGGGGGYTIHSIIQGTFSTYLHPNVQ